MSAALHSRGCICRSCFQNGSILQSKTETSSPLSLFSEIAKDLDSSYNTSPYRLCNLGKSFNCLEQGSANFACKEGPVDKYFHLCRTSGVSVAAPTVLLCGVKVILNNTE